MRNLVIAKDTLGFYSLPKVRITCDIHYYSFPTLLPSLSFHLFFILFFLPAVHSTYNYGIPNLRQ